jgi:biotin transport system substrate-specific component
MIARGKRGTGSRCREAGNAASGQDCAGIRCGILFDVLVKPHDLTALQCKILLFALGKEILPGALAGKLQSCGLLCKGVIKLHVLKALGGALLCLCGLFGFLLGLIPTAWVIGKIAEKDRSVPRLLLACFAGLAVLYLVGLPYIALIVNVYKGGNVSGMTLATAYMLPYLPGDCLKIVVSVILAPRILKAMERNS